MSIYSLLAPTLILIVAMITDIRTRKIYNRWVIISTVIALSSSFYFYGFEGLKQGALAAGVALLLTLPLVLSGILGAGDMKLMFAFGLATTYQAVFSVIIFAFIWAAVLGIIYSIAKGTFKQLLVNVAKILTFRGKSDLELHQIPFTVGIILGWFSYLSFAFKEGAIQWLLS